MDSGTLPGVGSWYRVMIPSVVIRPTLFKPFANHSAPSEPAVMADGLIGVLAPGNSVMTPEVVIRPMPRL
jgi:hypothetical protein